MGAIYRKEMWSHARSLAFYLSLAVFVAVSGIFFSVLCLQNGYTDYAAQVYARLPILYAVLTPILTMRMWAEERKQKTDQLLLTAPVRVSSIILGKYLAVLTLLLPFLAVTLGEAGFLSRYGKIPWRTVTAGCLGYFLLGACFLAMGFFFSAVTESPVAAAALSFGVALVSTLLPNLTGAMPGRARYTYAVCVIAILLLAWFFYDETKKPAAGAATAAVGAAVLGLAASRRPELFDNGIAKIVHWLSVTERFTDFCSGVWNMSSVVYYVSLAAVFLFLSAQTLEKRRWK